MKKLFLALLFCTSFFAFLGLPAHAQNVHQTTPQTAYPLNTDPNVPQNFHTYTQNVFIEVLSAATCFVGGSDILTQQPCLGINPQTNKIGYVEGHGGLTGIMANMLGATYDIPITTSQYTGYLASNFGITRTSYAALGEGIGFVGLTPVLEIWKTFRNLTYLLFVLVFAVLGLGIMFRLNIDARTVMTIQNQIPKIIIGLVLITLSYAIAGFLIDMMYVAIYLVIHVFDSQGLATITNIDESPIQAIGGVWGAGIHDIAYPAAKGVGGMVGSLFDGNVGRIIASVVTGIIGGFIGNAFGPVGSIVGGALGGLAGVLFGSKILGLVAIAIAYLIIAIAILQTLFRVWFMLIKAYIFIFLDVVFAPFWILGGILPGGNGGTGPWIRSLLANLSAFPTVLVLFMIGKAIQDQVLNGAGNFVPPLVGDPGSNSGEAIAAILGLGIILIMPEAVSLTKGVFKAPEMKFTSAIGQALGRGSGFVKDPFEGIWKELTGEKRDGSKGILRSTFEEGATKVGKNFAKRTGLTHVWQNSRLLRPVRNAYHAGKTRQAAKRAEYYGRTRPDYDASKDTSTPRPTTAGATSQQVRTEAAQRATETGGSVVSADEIERAQQEAQDEQRVARGEEAPPSGETGTTSAQGSNAPTDSSTGSS